MRYMDGLCPNGETFDCCPRVCWRIQQGALYALNWAALNPRSVHAYISMHRYAISRAGGRQSRAKLRRRLAAIETSIWFTEEQALAHPSNPVDSLAPIAAGIPIIAVYVMPI